MDPQPASLGSRLARGAVAVFSWAFALALLVTLARQAVDQRWFPTSPIDDEGYVMIGLQSFLDGGALYDEVFTQYGPAWFAIVGLPLELLHLRVDHELSRTITAITWVVAAALLSLAVGRSTRSVFAGAMALATSFLALTALGVEPLHPHGVGWVLLAACAVLGSRGAAGLGRAGAWGLGALIALLALTKVNLGAFVVLGGAIGLAGGMPKRRSARIAWWGAWAVTIAFATGLLARHAAAPDLRPYAQLVLCALLGLLAVALGAEREPGPTRALLRSVALGGAVASLLVLAVLFATGTSLAGAWYGLLGQHARLIEAPAAPLIHPRASVVELVSVLLAFGWCASRHMPSIRGWVDGACVVLALAWSGAVLTWLAENHVGLLFSYAAPFLWVPVALPKSKGSNGIASERPWMLAGLAALQLLQQYPVGGTHVTWSVLLLAPLAAQALYQSAAWVRERIEEDCELPRLAAIAWVGAALIAASVLRSRTEASTTFAAWYGRVTPPLGLHGGERLRPDEATAARLTWLATLARECDGFYSFPAQNGVYFLADVAPPTRLNVTFRLDLLRDEEQRRVVADLERCPRLLVACDGPGTVELYFRGEGAPPLAQWISTHCKRFECWGDWTIYKRGEHAGPKLDRARWIAEGLELATSAAVRGRVAVIELVDLATGLSLARTDDPQAGIQLVDVDGAAIDLRTTEPFAGPAVVRIVPRDAERRTRLQAVHVPVLRLLGPRDLRWVSYPIVREVERALTK
ncbi:MAG: hypothetical protein IPJ77_06375 [Planctomycetes bacterium]|nr:hypothetical protein [Planctomycetota bacterium]